MTSKQVVAAMPLHISSPSSSTTPSSAAATIVGSSAKVVEVSTVSIVHISDTHNHLPDISTLPKGDVLIHTGDFSDHGTIAEIQVFNDWLGRVKSMYRYRIIILGNHDQETITNDIPRIRKLLTNATHVPGVEIIDLHGLHVLCYPWLNIPVHTHNHDVTQWIQQACDELKRNKSKSIDLLCSHMPALGHMEWTLTQGNKGFESVKSVLQYVQPQVFLFGHVHEHHGYMTIKHLPVIETPSPSARAKSSVFNSTLPVVSATIATPSTASTLATATAVAVPVTNTNVSSTPIAPSKTPIKGLKQSLLVNSALCHKASDGIVNCAHIVQYRRVVTEKEEPQQVSQLPSQTQGVKKIKTATYTLQGVMQKQML